MRLRARISAGLRSLFSRREMNNDLADELRFHLEQQIEANLAAGMEPEQARRQALIAFGGLESIKEDCRDQWGARLLDSTAKDLHYALRGFHKNPLFTLAVVCTIALGIGASTAVFSFVDRILFRSLPYPHAARLVSVGITAPIENNEFMLGANYAYWREARLPFSAITSMTAFDSAASTCDLTEIHPLRMNCLQVESNFLAVLGLSPALGRGFAPDDDRPNAPPVALISYGLWRSRFGGSAVALGTLMSVDGKPVRVVGILPRGFEMPTLAAADLLLPQRIDWNEQKTQPTGRVLRCFARLKPGLTMEQARAQLHPLVTGLLKTTPPQFRNEIHLAVRSLRDRELGDSRLAAWVLLGAVLAVLLIACANVANLLLARSAARQRDLAVRVALGASRARMVRQALTENLVLALSGGALGCALGYGLLRVFVGIAPKGVPRLQPSGLDHRVLLFTLAVSVACGLVFGLVPALHRAPPQLALVGTRSSAGSRGLFRQMLVVAQVAISLVLLAGASLLLRSLWNLQNQPLGMRTDSLLLAEITLGRQRYRQPEQQLAFFDQMETRLRRLPGVSDLALSDSLPPGGWQHFHIYAAINVRGRPRSPEGTGGDVTWRSVTPQYFSALDIPIVRGRGFTEADRGPVQHATVLSRRLAERLFPGEDPLGQQLQFGEGPWYTVIGVAADVKNGGLSATGDPEYYVARRHAAAAAGDPRSQVDTHAYVIVRTAMKAAAMSAWVRSEIAALDPTLPVSVDTMRQRVSQMEARPRFDAALLSLFAVLGVLLAAIGVYGVVAFLVTQRTQEIGVRMALGASTGDVLRLVTGKGLLLIVTGGMLGIGAALGLSRLLRGLLFEIEPNDPLTLCSAAGMLLVVALLATFIPAFAATRIDPMVALRWE
ncbi:MAG TPA: ABC transporter permease [Terriglobales bacterium]|nr:ABC transporter permease [Terriglobales bacterium]